jgi:phosphatidylserine decarboxylase
LRPKIRQRLRTKLEEIRQARSIHGGAINLCAAALGVRLSRLWIPSRRLRLRLFRTVYGKRFASLDEGELERPLAEYASLNSLFTRAVKPGLRPIAEAPAAFVGPCDGTVQDAGRIHGGRILTVKGVEYTVNSLLPQVDTGPFEGGPFGIFFLSPRDCHRVFSPQDGRVVEVIHVPGYRLLVHPPYQRQEYPVFELNERVILRLATPTGACVLVLVAGWGVGQITLPWDVAFRPKARKLVRKAYSPPPPVCRGQWLATFELGSTAILIAEPGTGLAPLVSRGDVVRYGQPVFGPTCERCDL